MSFLQPFNAANVAPAKRLEPIPAGVYNARIIDSDVKPLASGNGEGISFTWEVIDGPCANRKIFQRINYRHTNPQAEQIGQSELSAICHATGVIQLQDTTQLHNRPCRVRVKIRKDKNGQYDDRNEIGGVEPAGAAMPGMPPAMPAQAMPTQTPSAAAPAATATPPWQRRAG